MHSILCAVLAMIPQGQGGYYSWSYYPGYNAISNATQLTALGPTTPVAVKVDSNPFFSFNITGKDMDTYNATGSSATTLLSDQLSSDIIGEMYPMAMTFSGVNDQFTHTWILSGQGLIPATPPQNPEQYTAIIVPAKTYYNRYRVYDMIGQGKPVILKDGAIDITVVLQQPSYISGYTPK